MKYNNENDTIELIYRHAQRSMNPRILIERINRKPTNINKLLYENELSDFLILKMVNLIG